MQPAPQKSLPRRAPAGWTRAGGRGPLAISAATLQAAREADATIAPDVWGSDYPDLPAADVARLPATRRRPF
ncbi:hypothetical protein [Hymenobacter persicinus]|uniref:Uncharacterized protein n=1 Tax=Hymenobacter persicinus TaxID=2025506 RepID=A0A4V1ZA64_9BACT|nr:hypothetical protein [Hymenobacter persicinus]RYU72605.1 hypothetical protein EWM57_20885 [Hymenobacter persicinus]RYU76033.1 hypothetical protein EWM57_19230 [Hymenobacter persicinus]